MAINRSLYYQAPAPSVSYKNTPAYEYASIFLKNRADQWQISQTQAASEIARGDTRDKMLFEAYEKQAAALDKRIADLSNAINDAGRDQAKAINAAALAAQSEATARARLQADREAKAVEQQTVSQPSTSQSSSQSSGSSFGGGGVGGDYRKGVGAISDDAQSIIDTQRSMVGAEPNALANAAKINGERSGYISTSDPKQTDDFRYRTVETSIQDQAERLLAADPNLDLGVARDLAAKSVLDTLDSGGNHAFAASWESVSDKLKNPMGPGGASAGSSRSSSQSTRVGGGAVQKNKYPGLPDVSVSEVPLAAVVKSEDLTGKLKELEAERAALTAPDSQSPDFITRSREIMAGRFGPVQQTPNFYQRNVVQGLQANLTHPAVQSAFQAWKAARDSGAPSPASTPIVPVEPQAQFPLASDPRSSGAPPEQSPSVQPTTLTPEEMQAIAEAAAGAATPALTEAELLALAKHTERQRSQGAGNEAPSSGITVTPGASGGVPTYESIPGLKTSPRTTVTPGTASTGYSVSPGGYGGVATPEFYGSLKTSPRSGADTVRDAEAKRQAELNLLFPDGIPPELQPAAASTEQQRNPNLGDVPFEPIAPNKIKEEDLVSYGDFTGDAIGEPVGSPRKPHKFTETGSKLTIPNPKKDTGPSKITYYTNRIAEGTTLAAQPDKLARLAASGPGKVARDMFQANSKMGVSFEKTYEELTLTFAGQPEQMKTAHNVALALDIASRNAKTPKE